MSDPIKAALVAAEQGETTAAKIALFLRALPGGGLYVSSGMISRPQQIADAVIQASIEQAAEKRRATSASPFARAAQEARDDR